MIPKIIHQTWKNKNLPYNFKVWSNSFKELNDEFQYNFYDDSENLKLVQEHLPELLYIYNSFSREIYRVDFVRPLYLFLFGGFYVDMDFQCLRKFDKYLESKNIILGMMGTNPDFQHSVPNALMGSPKGSGFWIFYLSMIVEGQAKIINGARALEPEFITGPVKLKECLDYYNNHKSEVIRKVVDFIKKYQLSITIDGLIFNDITLMPSHIWYPINWDDRVHQLYRQTYLNQENLLSIEEARSMFPYSDAVTYWTHSWPGIDIGQNLKVSGIVS